MNTIIQQGIDSANESLVYWGIELEKVQRHNDSAVDDSHKLTTENIEAAIKAAEAQLDEQFRIAKELVEKNELIQSDVEDYLAFLQRAIDTLKSLYEQYPNPVLKVVINTLEKIVSLVKKIIELFG